MQARFKVLLIQPFTFGGVAAFAQVSFSWLWAFQVVVALLAAGALAFFFETAWAPVITRTIALLPEMGQIRHATLDWPAASTVRAAPSSFLQISIDPNDSIETGEGADLLVQLGKTELRFRSFFGTLEFPYPNGYIVALNRPAVEPWWGAWHWGIILAAGAAFMVGLFLSWTLLALLYLVPVRFIGFYADRNVSWTGAWRLAAASLLPGALFLTGSIAAYAVHQINLVHLMFAAVLHLVVGWVYVLAAPFSLPRVPEVSGRRPGAKNPFGSGKPKSDNPFAGRGK